MPQTIAYGVFDCEFDLHSHKWSCSERWKLTRCVLACFVSYGVSTENRLVMFWLASCHTGLTLKTDCVCFGLLPANPHTFTSPHSHPSTHSPSQGASNQKNGVCEVLYAAAWVTGEFAEFLDEPLAVVTAMLQPRVTSLPGHIQGVYVHNVIKVRLCARVYVCVACCVCACMCVCVCVCVRVYSCLCPIPSVYTCYEPRCDSAIRGYHLKPAQYVLACSLSTKISTVGSV